MSILRFFGKTIYYAVFLLIVSVTGLLLISLFPIENNFQVKTVLSGSMEPAIHTGSVIIIKAADTYGVGDVITFGKDSKSVIPVTHRIVEMKQVGYRTTYLTQGDANDNIDPVQPAKSDVIGKVLFTIPYLGFMLDFVKQPAGFLSLVIIPSVLIVVSEAVKIVHEVMVKRMRKQQPVAQRKVRQTTVRVAPPAHEEVQRPTDVVVRKVTKRYI